MFLCAQGKVRVQLPDHSGETHVQNGVPHNQWVPFGATQQIPDHNQSLSSKSLSFSVLNDCTVPGISTPFSQFSWVNSARGDALIPSIGPPRCPNIHTRGKPHKLIPHLSIDINGSHSDVFRVLPVSSLTGCLYSLIDRKRIPKAGIINSVCYRPGLWLSIGHIGWIKSPHSSSSFLNTPGPSHSHHGNPDHVHDRWIDFFAEQASGPTAERCVQ